MAKVTIAVLQARIAELERMLAEQETLISSLQAERATHVNHINDLIEHRDELLAKCSGTAEEIAELIQERDDFKAAGISLAKELQAYKVKDVNDAMNEALKAMEDFPSMTTCPESGAPQVQVQRRTSKEELLYRIGSKGQHPMWQHINVTSNGDEFMLRFPEEFRVAHQQDCYEFLGNLIRYLQANAKRFHCDASFGKGCGRILIRPKGWVAPGDAVLPG